MQALIDIFAKSADPEVKELMPVVKGYGSILCACCGGSGHNETNCATRKSIRKTFKAMGKGEIYGRVFGGLKLNNMLARKAFRRIRLASIATAGTLTEEERKNYPAVNAMIDANFKRHKAA